MTKRRCVHSPSHPSKGRKFRGKAVKMMLVLAKKMGLPSRTIRDLGELPRILEAMSHGPEWPGFRKAARLIVKKWGYDVGQVLFEATKMLVACLEVELGCARKMHRNKVFRMAKRTSRAPVDLKGMTMVAPGDLVVGGKPLFPEFRKKGARR